MKQPYYRILLGMSTFDVLCSASLCFSTAPIPAGTEGVWGAKGTTQTCTASGFFNQFMLGSFLYNLVLAIYYSLSGTYRMTDEDFARKYEPILHVLAVLATVGIAVGEILYSYIRFVIDFVLVSLIYIICAVLSLLSAGLPLTLYNNAQLWCWIAPYPLGCESFSGEHDPDFPCERGYEAWLYRWLFFYGPLWAVIIIVTVLMIMLTLSVMKDEKEIITLRNRSIEARRKSYIEEQEDPSDRTGENNNSERRLRKTDSFRLERTKKMFYQALLYVGVFYITWIIPTINRFMQLIRGSSVFALLVLSAFLAPMQGFWNWLVYRHGPCVG